MAVIKEEENPDMLVQIFQANENETKNKIKETQETMEIVCTMNKEAKKKRVAVRFLKSSRFSLYKKIDQEQPGNNSKSQIMNLFPLNPVTKVVGSNQLTHEATHMEWLRLRPALCNKESEGWN